MIDQGITRADLIDEEIIFLLLVFFAPLIYLTKAGFTLKRISLLWKRTSKFADDW